MGSEKESRFIAARMIQLLLIVAFLSFGDTLVSIDFENGTDWAATDWNIGTFTGSCTGKDSGFATVLDPEQPGTGNQVGKIRLTNCGQVSVDGESWPKSDNRGEGFVLRYHERDSLRLRRTYFYVFSVYIPEDYHDFAHQRDGEDWAIISQWPCWSSDPQKTCPKSDPDLYCSSGHAGLGLTLRGYTYDMHFRVSYPGESDDDCIVLDSVGSSRGGWDHHVMEIRFSSENDGYIRWWINNSLVGQAFDFRTWWASPVSMPAWKLGMYLGSYKDGPWTSPDSDITLYFDNLSILENTTLSEVCPNCKEESTGIIQMNAHSIGKMKQPKYRLTVHEGNRSEPGTYYSLRGRRLDFQTNKLSDHRIKICVRKETL